jgi:hypothetical protein
MEQVILQDYIYKTLVITIAWVTEASFFAVTFTEGQPVY